MAQRKVIETTLGDLILAVTDEVMPFVDDPSDLYIVASCVLNDLLAHRPYTPSGQRSAEKTNRAQE